MPWNPSFFERLLVSYGNSFPIRRGKFRLIEKLWRLAVRNPDARRMAILKHGNFLVSCDLNEFLHRQYYFFGTYFLEEHLIECWMRHAKTAQIVFDVGANAGIFSLATLSVQQHAVIHAFEPTPEIADSLRKTAALNGIDTLHVHELAVMSSDGTAALIRYRGEHGQNGGMNFISPPAAENEAELIRTVCIDSFCSQFAIGQIDLLKLDIQGNEYQALEGAKNMLNLGRVRVIFMELNWMENPDGLCSAEQSIRLLESAGYLFSPASKRMHWQKSGKWMRDLNDVVAGFVR